MSDCLLSLVVSLPGIIVICGLIALYCIVLFDTTPVRGQTKTIKFREPGKIKYNIHNVTASPNTSQEDIEFDTCDLPVKVEKEISPGSIVCLEIFPKEQLVPGISQEVDPRSNVRQVQMMTDAQKDRSSDKQSYVLTFPYLQNTLCIVLEIISGTSQKISAVRSTTISKNRKSKQAARAKPRRQQK